MEQQTDPPVNVQLSTSSATTLPATTSTNVGHVPQMGTHFDVSLPPAPPQVKEKIISGEFVDFATLLSSTMFSGSIRADTSKSLTVQLTPMGNDLSVRPQPPAKKITSFTSWMEAWNIYLAILIDHSPVHAPQLVAYQRIITSPTNVQRPTTTSTSNDGQQPISGGLPNFRPSTCHAYNRSTCRRQNCSFLHQCELCGADHSAKYCPNRGSTAQLTQAVDSHTTVHSRTRTM